MPQIHPQLWFCLRVFHVCRCVKSNFLEIWVSHSCEHQNYRTLASDTGWFSICLSVFQIKCFLHLHYPALCIQAAHFCETFVPIEHNTRSHIPWDRNFEVTFDYMEWLGKYVERKSWNVAKVTLLIFAEGNKKTPQTLASARYSKEGNGKQKGKIYHCLLALCIKAGALIPRHPRLEARTSQQQVADTGNSVWKSASPALHQTGFIFLTCQF